VITKLSVAHSHVPDDGRRVSFTQAQMGRWYKSTMYMDCIQFVMKVPQINTGKADLIAIGKGLITHHWEVVTYSHEMYTDPEVIELPAGFHIAFEQSEAWLTT
jgi:hypothetical protein